MCFDLRELAPGAFFCFFWGGGVGRACASHDLPLFGFCCCLVLERTNEGGNGKNFLFCGWVVAIYFVFLLGVVLSARERRTCQGCMIRGGVVTANGPSCISTFGGVWYPKPSFFLFFFVVIAAAARSEYNSEFAWYLSYSMPIFCPSTTPPPCFAIIWCCWSSHAIYWRRMLYPRVSGCLIDRGSGRPGARGCRGVVSAADAM